MVAHFVMGSCERLRFVDGWPWHAAIPALRVSYKAGPWTMLIFSLVCFAGQWFPPGTGSIYPSARVVKWDVRHHRNMISYIVSGLVRHAMSS
jgi:hypothetical protein